MAALRESVRQKQENEQIQEIALDGTLSEMS
jgi:hypothetical protein